MTHQQRSYEQAYSNHDSEYGMPDRKIADKQHLQGKRILSLGSGSGSDAWYLAKDNLVVGLDYVMTGLRIGCRHGIRGAVVDLGFRPVLPFDDGSFDVIVCKDVLEHLLEPLALLLEMRRVLKGDGYAVISVPNHFYLPLRMRILFGQGLLWKTIGHDHSKQYDEWNYMHIRFFTYRGLRGLLYVADFLPEKWFWDFGGLAHYSDPEMWLEPQSRKRAHGLPLSRRASLAVTVLWPVWKMLNLVFPRRLRRAVVSVAPGLLCAGFYVRARKA